MGADPNDPQAPGSIDYRPLLAMDGAWKLAFRATIKLWGPAFAVGFILVSLAAGPGLAIDLAIAAGALYATVVTKKASGIKNGVWQEFASANGWPLDVNTAAETVVPPSLQFGHSRELSPVIQANLGGMTCDLLSYTCVTGYGKNQQTHNFTIACVALPKSLPHMLLLSNKAYIEERNDMDNGEHLKLEGDFNDYFSLQVEKGQEVDVLAILTPDVMQALIDYNQAEDIEILGSNLYFVAKKDQRDYKDMQVILRSVVELSRQVFQNIHPSPAPLAPASAAEPEPPTQTAPQTPAQPVPQA